MSNVISSKYQIVIPKQLRRQLGLKPGQKMHAEATKEGYVLLKKDVPVSYRDLMGTVPAQATDPVERIRKLRDDWHSVG